MCYPCGYGAPGIDYPCDDNRPHAREEDAAPAAPVSRPVYRPMGPYTIARLIIAGELSRADYVDTRAGVRDAMAYLYGRRAAVESGLTLDERRAGDITEPLTGEYPGDLIGLGVFQSVMGYEYATAADDGMTLDTLCEAYLNGYYSA